MRNNSFDNLLPWAESSGIPLSCAQREKLRLFVKELWTWQGKMNLVGVTTKNRVISELLMDSLVPLPYLPETGRLLDLGSGGGFPAIPLKICLPAVHFQLLEPVNRKSVFLRHIIRLLELDRIGVLSERIEESGDRLTLCGYDTITARAVSSLHQTLEWCLPYLALGGELVTFQGCSWKKVLEESSGIMKKKGLVVSRTLPYRLPGKNAKRTILFFSKKAS